VRVNNGNWQPATGTASWYYDANLTLGSNTVDARSKDGAGNYSGVTSITVSYQIDQVAPTVVIDFPPNNSSTTSSTVTVSGGASDPGVPSSGIVSVEVRVNNGIWQTATGTTSWNLLVSLSPGSNTIEVRSRDNAANYSSIAKTIIDSQPTPPPPNTPYEAKWAATLNTFNARAGAKAQGGGLMIVGDFSGTIKVGGQSLTSSGGNPDLYAVKFDDKNNPVWVKQYGGSGEDTMASCVQHPAGGWIVCGTFQGTTTIGSTSLQAAGQRDAFIARLDENGNVLWARRAGGTDIDYGKKVAVDGLGNCFLAGVFTTSATFDGSSTVLTATGNAFDVFVAKYAANGDFQWAKSAGGPQYDDLYCAGADAAGNLYIGGIFSQSTTFGSFTLTNPDPGWDGYLAKFSASGSVVWAKRFGQSSSDFSSDTVEFLDVRPDGTCFFSGGYQLAMNIDGQGLPGQENATGFVGKMNNSGTVEWLRALQTSSVPENNLYFSHSSAFNGAASSDGGMIVYGKYLGKITFGSTTVTNPTPGIDRMFIAKVDATGIPLWIISSDGPGFAYVSYFASEADRVRVAGQFYQTINLPGISPITANTGESVLVEIGPPDLVLHPMLNGNNLTLTWPIATGFNLEWTTTIPAINWATETSAPTITGGNYSVSIQTTGNGKFYRLKK